MGHTSENKIIRAGWLIDGSGGEVLKDCLIELSGEEISSISLITHDIALPHLDMDFSDCTIIPGLVDCHTHLSISGSLDTDARKHQWDDGYINIRERINRHIKEYLRYGVVAVRDGGDFGGFVFKYKQDDLSNTNNHFILKTPQKAWHAEGRYGKLLGRSPEAGKGLFQSILESFEPGINHIKIINSGINSLKVFGKETPPQFDVDELRRAVKTGNELGLKIMVHANGYEPVKNAIEAGCHSIEHGFFMGDDNLKKMAEAGVVWVPTMCTMKAYMDSSNREKAGYMIAEKNLDHQMAQVEKAVKYGVTIVLGTDSGSPGIYHGSSIIEELRLLIKCGLSIEQAVKCATSNAMQMIGDDSQDGTVSKGMRATFLVIKGSPDNLPDTLSTIYKVLIKGNISYQSIVNYE